MATDIAAPATRAGAGLTSYGYDAAGRLTSTTKSGSSTAMTFGPTN